jgi:hypothetical protein
MYEELFCDSHAICCNSRCCLSVCLSSYLSVYFSIHLSASLPAYPPTYPTYLPSYPPIYLLLFLPLGALFYFSFLILVSRIPWMGISPTEHLYLRRTTQISLLPWDSNHDPSVRACEDISCLRPRGHYGRQLALVVQC